MQLEPVDPPPFQADAVTAKLAPVRTVNLFNAAIPAILFPTRAIEPEEDLEPFVETVGDEHRGGYEDLGEVA